MECNFYAISCAGTPVSMSLMSRVKTASFSNDQRRMAFSTIIARGKNVDKPLESALMHMFDVGRFAPVEDETQDIFFGPKTQRITYNMPDFTLLPCFAPLVEGSTTIAIAGAILGVDNIKLSARTNITIKVSRLSEADALLIFKERPGDCIEAYIPIPANPSIGRVAQSSKEANHKNA